jgi:hypothetical protein
MKKRLLILLVTIPSVITFTECKKKEKTVPELSKTEKLAGTSSKTYKITSDVENGSNMLTFPNYDQCNLDDLYKYYTDHKYVHLDATDKCGSNDTISAGTWIFNASQDSLIIDTSNDLEDQTVKVNISSSSFETVVGVRTKTFTAQ